MNFDPNAWNLLVGIMAVLLAASIAFTLIWFALGALCKSFVWLVTWPWLAYQSYQERGSGHRVTGRAWNYEVDGE